MLKTNPPNSHLCKISSSSLQGVGADGDGPMNFVGLKEINKLQASAGGTFDWVFAV